jgi:hypothetical protein
MPLGSCPLLWLFFFLLVTLRIKDFPTRHPGVTAVATHWPKQADRIELAETASECGSHAFVVLVGGSSKPKWNLLAVCGSRFANRSAQQVRMFLGELLNPKPEGALARAWSRILFASVSA